MMNEDTKKIRLYRKVLYVILAPIIIGSWCVMNPRKVLEQAKKDFNMN